MYIVQSEHHNIMQVQNTDADAETETQMMWSAQAFTDSDKNRTRKNIDLYFSVPYNFLKIEMPPQIEMYKINMNTHYMCSLSSTHHAHGALSLAIVRNLFLTFPLFLPLQP